MIRPHEEQRLAELTAQIENGTYLPSGAEIAERIFTRPFVSQKDGPVERYLKQHGSLLIGDLPQPVAESFAELRDTRVCREHHVEYPLISGLQEFDCPECRARSESQKLLLVRVRQRREDDFRQASGMEHDAEVPAPFLPFYNPSQRPRDRVRDFLLTCLLAAILGSAVFFANQKAERQKEERKVMEGRP